MSLSLHRLPPLIVLTALIALGLGTTGCEEEQEAAEQPAAPALGPREPQPSVSGMVGINRAAGVLPSRRGALLALMNLQTKLFVKGENADAVVCTNAIQTIQELLERVEKLSHTAGV